jgi:anti-sigma regulatory factor (Ser/Thr protein kinase)
MSGGMGFYASAAPAAAARAAGGGAGAGRAVMPRSSGVTRARVPVPPPRDQGLRMAVTWPLRTFLELGAFPGAVPSARLHAKALAWEWGVACGDAVELVVSEIVTNAIQASGGLPLPGVVRLWLLSDRERVLVLVWDASPHHPVSADESMDEVGEGGRGLMLVGAMSERWSWYPDPETSGKVVWALCGPSAERGLANAR